MKYASQSKNSERQKFFTRTDLVTAARQAEAWGYNRQLLLEPVEKLPNLDYPVTCAIKHRHRQGVPCEVHVRCMVYLGPPNGDAHIIVDVPTSFYRKLRSR